jgi:hypothetical protein
VCAFAFRFIIGVVSDAADHHDVSSDAEKRDEQDGT